MVMEAQMGFYEVAFWCSMTIHFLLFGVLGLLAGQLGVTAELEDLVDKIDGEEG